MASKGGGGKQITGYRYSMAVHSGISRGPLNELLEIRVGDLIAWAGSITSSDFFTIDRGDLFGGDEKEGGISGTAKLFMGEPTQTIDPIITDNIEGDNPVPSWRGTATVFYYGQVTSNNPYPKAWKFKVRRTTAGWDNDAPWYPDLAMINVGDDETIVVNFLELPKDKQYLILNDTNVYFRTDPQEFDVAIGDSTDTTATNFAAMVNLYADTLGATAVASGDEVALSGTPLPVVSVPYAFANITAGGVGIHAMNPAHILWECATNNIWGRGLPAAMMDDAGFRKAADTLYAEGLGLCLRWNREDDIDAFVQLVIDHIGGVLLIDRETGLLTLRLIRNDYTVSALPEYSFTNGLLDITDDQTSSSDTMYNEIIVKYTDPTLDKVGAVRVQNLASFQSLGTLISQTTEYLGIPTSTLALRLAQRDLEVKSVDLRRMTLTFTRAGWKIAPGDVIKINVPSRGINSMIMRVGEVEEDPLTGEKITVKAVQDVFGLPSTSFIDPQESFFTQPDRTARVIEDRALTEMTYYDFAANLPPATLADTSVDTGWIKIFAKQPNGVTIQYDVWTRADGEPDIADRSTAGFDSTALLAASIGHYDTLVTFETGSLLSNVSAGDLLLIDNEYMHAVAVGAGTMTVERGVIDSIPAPHTEGVRLWWQTAMPTTDFRNYSSGELVWVRLQPRTTSNALDLNLTEIDSITIAGRQGRPYPPGDVRVNTVPFGNSPLLYPTGDITLTWTHRDRVVQGNTILAHDAASTGPEPGTTYTVRVYAADGVTLLHTVAGIAGTTWTYDAATILTDGDPGSIWVDLESVRDGYPSYYHYHIHVYRRIGFDYGFDYLFDEGA